MNLNALRLFFTSLFIILSGNLLAESNFQVTLLRAHPGELASLITEVQIHKKAHDNNLLILRHSQGDHWDLMLLSPAPKTLTKPKSFAQWVDFQQDFLANSETSWQITKNRAKNTNLFHVEMFQAASGKYDALLEQRKMENAYYRNTNREGNIIFETLLGSDTDIFTIGFYKDLMAFATDPDLSEATFEKAAKDAGFASRDSIGLYLRKFLVSHQDTLATQIH